MRTEARYIVAEIKDDTLLPNTVTLEWTYAVYADLGEARAELLDALAAGLSDHRVYEIRLRPVLMALAPPASDGDGGPDFPGIAG